MRTNLRMTYLIKRAIQQKLSLMILGPTPVQKKFYVNKHPIGHRSKEFQELVESTTVHESGYIKLKMMF